MSSIKITIPADDQEPVKVEGVEYSGHGCVKDIDAILDLLGGDADRQKTADYYCVGKVSEKTRA